MRIKSILVTAVILIVSLFSYAQTKEQEVEEIYLKNPELMIIREQVLSSDFRTQLQALDMISDMVEGGNVNNEVENLLIMLGEEGSATKKYMGRTIVNNYPDVRKRACTILGQVGTPKAKEGLITILLSESEPMVKAEAAYALGVIGDDEKGEAAVAIAWVLDKEDPVFPDNNFAYAVILAFEKIAAKNNGLKNSAAGYTALIKIAQGNYIRAVKNKAIETIRGMKKYAR